MDFDRRGILRGGAAIALMASISKAASIDATVRSGSIADVGHVVILTQENRSFDHYFGAMNGVRGFADRFPIPVSGVPGAIDRTVWTQVNSPAHAGEPTLISPFPLNTGQHFEHMRVEGTPHTWSDAQAAWNEGRMGDWPSSKTERSMGYYRREDIPFQYALADAFTLCDGYHASIQSGTNSNRLFIWTATNDPSGLSGGPSISNSHDRLEADGGHPDAYRWRTYVERLQDAGVSWRIYQDMNDNFADNPVAGFKSFRDSHQAVSGSDPRLAALGLSTWAVDGLRADVLADRLPQVSYVVAPAADSEHPGPSSPAQGADYTARVLDALTANPAVWSNTVLLVMFDENDGFFDHVPPPAPPSVISGAGSDARVLGGSTVDTAGEYHRVRTASEAPAERLELMGRPYGLGPRVPMYVISPWSRGGWVNSEVFDHTSVIRFLERRFGVREPNLSAWRRSVCGDLTSAFDFRTPNDTAFRARLPETHTIAARAAALPGRTVPATPASPAAPIQAEGPRPSRALPYALEVAEVPGDGGFSLDFRNDGRAGAVFHVYDRRRLGDIPRRYTVGAGQAIRGVWGPGFYDLWVSGPNGFHRHFVGDADQPGLLAIADVDATLPSLRLTIRNTGRDERFLSVTPNAYEARLRAWSATLAGNQSLTREWDLSGAHGWYDLSVRDRGAHYLRRLAGRVESGRDSISDPAMSGPAVMTRGSA